MVLFESGLSWSNSVSAALVRFEPIKTGLRRSRPVSAGLVGFEPVKTGLSWSGAI